MNSHQQASLLVAFIPEKFLSDKRGISVYFTSNEKKAFLDGFEMQPPDTAGWRSPLDIPFPSLSHLSCVARGRRWCWSNWPVLTSQSCTTPPNALEMTWTVQVNAKHLDSSRWIDSERTSVFSRRSMVMMSCLLCFCSARSAGAKFMCDIWNNVRFMTTAERQQ